jgi:hypothetical protein
MHKNINSEVKNIVKKLKEYEFIFLCKVKQKPIMLVQT